MIHELEPAEYSKLGPLLCALDIHLAMRAVVEGGACAQAWVDDPRTPHTALVRVGHRFFFTGDARNDSFNDSVRQLFTETLCPQAIQAGAAMLIIYYAPDDWENAVGMLLCSTSRIKRAREYYRLTELKHDWRARLAPDFTLQFVNAALLENPQIKNLATLKEEMCSERASVEDFLAKSFGVAAVCDNTLAGFCLSEYNCADACEIGIATMAPYQKRGVATAMACTLIEHARTRGVTQIGWHCYTSNVASAATARKIGFEKVCDYPAVVARTQPITVPCPF